MQNKSESFTLCMLGTDTNYTPNLKKQAKKSLPQPAAIADYPKGETLSIISNLIESREIQIDHNSPVPYKRDAVTVINGPVTSGSNVGEKIGLGLAEILLAIARGKQAINIIAHSRGAVESVLIAHELQAACKLIDNCASIDDLVDALKEQQTTRHKSKPTNNTPDIIDSLRKQLNVISKEQQPQWFQSLKDNISGAKLNFFGIDPVPGDCIPITWYDERYFTLPAIVKNGQILYYENERSDWGFTPAYVEAEDTQTQQLKHYSIPGHHGTGSAGNNASQQKTLLGGRTTHVQKLILFKLLDFLNQSGVCFKDLGESLFKKHAGLGAKYIKQNADGLKAQAFDIKNFNFPAIYRELYERITEHRSAYDAYNESHYKYMGVVQQRRLLKKGHDKDHEYGLFTDAFILQEGLINAEHSTLIREHLFAQFGLANNNCALPEFVKRVNEKLPDVISKLELTSTDTNLNDSTVLVECFNENLVSLDDQRQQEVKKTFAKMIQSVSASYLNVDWSSVEKQKEKELLFTEIKKLFASFDQLVELKNEDAQTFVTTLKNQSIDGINKVIKQQLEVLNNNFSQLEQAKNSRIAQYFKSLAQPSVIDLDTEIYRILALSDYELTANCLTKEKIVFIVNELRKSAVGLGLVNKIENDFATNNPPLEGQPFAPLDISKELTNAFVEQYEDSLEQFAVLYEQMAVFIKDIGGLRALLPEQAKVYAGYVEKLSAQLKQLVQMAASKFYQHHQLDDLPAAVEGSFAVDVRNYAVAHYDGLAEQLQLAEKAGLLQKEIDSLKSEQNNAQREHQQQVEAINSTNQGEILELRAQNNETLIAQQQAQQQQAQQQHQLAVQQITDRAADERNKLEQQHKLALEAQQQAHNEQLDQHITKHTKVLALSEEKAGLLQKEIDSLKSEQNNAQREHQQQVEAINSTNQDQILELCAQNKEALRAQQQAQQQHELTVQQITDTAADERNKLEQQHKQALEAQQQAHNEQLDQDITKHTKVLALLNNEREAQCLLLIRDKLRPLTRDYLQHLNASSTNPEKLDIKRAHVASLLTALDDNVKTIKASERVDNFYLALDKAAGDLQQHRDPGWKLFVRNAVICGAILASGILPGLLFLVAYTKITGNPYAFWSSKGAHYLSTVNGLSRPEHNEADEAPQAFELS